MFDPQTYRCRRDRLTSRFQTGLLLFLGHPDAARNYADNPYPFRQDSSFLYYWGLAEPDMAALIDVETGEQILFGDDWTVEDIVWRGPQPTVAERAAASGITRVKPLRDLAVLLAEARKSGRQIHYLPPYRAELDLKFEALLEIPAREVRSRASVELIKAVVDQRARKSREEIDEIEGALEISRDMQILAMRMSRPGALEREVVGAVTGLVESRGGQLAFPIIFSVHGETLHNHSHGNRMKEGDLIVHDSGAESASGYASDLTRTIPVGGRFSSLQREMYGAVQRAQQAALDAIRPGILFRDVHLLACRSLAESLKEVGCLRGKPEDIVSAGAHALFFPCGLGHMMGLDVHDMEGLGESFVGYDDTVSRSSQFGLRSLRMGRALEPGFVLTVEPGIYLIPELIDQWRAEGKCREFIDYDRVDRIRNFGGIRIEDDIEVTEEGCRVLGPPVPVHAPEVEALASS